MILGIEIGGTKLQLGIAPSESDSKTLVTLERATIDRALGAEGILQQIKEIAPSLISIHRVRQIGIGFGGPVDGAHNRVITSHQVHGWDDVPLGDWCLRELGLPVTMGNDCNVAALAEAVHGAGEGAGRVFYVTIGTGIGGGLVVDGRIDGESCPAIAEIGHLRPGLDARDPQQTVESFASGLGIESRARDLLASGREVSGVDELRTLDPLSAETVIQAALAGNAASLEIFDQATLTLGWAIAQVLTIAAPQRVVIGGGVSLVGEPLFQRLRETVGTFVFPPLANDFELVPASLGEETVVVGAVELARTHGVPSVA